MQIMNGYIFKFKGHGAFSPDGKIDMADSEIAAHNKQVSDSQIESMKRGESQILYCFEADEVGTWDGSHKWETRRRTSKHNWGLTRTDYWFNAFGHNWHGVNIGDNCIVRSRVVKH